MRKRTGVLIHSINLQAPKREEAVWGVPPNLLGRFSMGIKVALEEEAEIIVLGNGLRSGINGEMESEFNWKDIMANFDRLAEFTEFQGIDLGRGKKEIERILVLDKSSLNTADEVAFAGQAFESAGMKKVISVSDRTHAPRCLNEALKFYSWLGSKIAVHNVSVQVSDIGWAPNDDVVILEPPHMPNNPMGDLRQRVAKMLLRQDKLLEIKKTLGL